MGEQTVTVYRKKSGVVTRRVVKRCFFHREDRLQEDDLGRHVRKDFLLIVPPGRYVPRLGDRVLEGIGLKAVDWDTFVPGTVFGLGEVGRVEAYRLHGKLHHYEASFC